MLSGIPFVILHTYVHLCLLFYVSFSIHFSYEKALTSLADSEAKQETSSRELKIAHEQMAVLWKELEQLRKQIDGSTTSNKIERLVSGVCVGECSMCVWCVCLCHYVCTYVRTYVHIMFISLIVQHSPVIPQPFIHMLPSVRT